MTELARQRGVEPATRARAAGYAWFAGCAIGWSLAFYPWRRSRGSKRRAR